EDIPSDIQGRSLTPLLRGETPDDWRKTHYYHYYQGGGHGVPVHFGVTNVRYKLIRFPDPALDTWEFFDLENDPMELRSLYHDPNSKPRIDEMKRELSRLREKFQVPDDFAPVR
ncbi:MAG: sulfatase/phosphatase domain-containing protein, partial [Verrucomicrobiota bacterium]